jgi:hypothetical protein
MRTLLIALMMIIATQASAVEKIVLLISEGQNSYDVYSTHSREGFDTKTSYHHNFGCKFRVTIRNHTTTDIILEFAALQADTTWIDFFVKNNFDKKFNLPNMPTIQEQIYLQNGFGERYGGFYVAQGESKSRTRGPYFVFTTREPLSVETVNKIQSQFGCASLDYMEFALDWFESFQFRDKRKLELEELKALVTIDEAPQIFSQTINSLLPENSTWYWLSDFGLFVGKDW